MRKLVLHKDVLKELDELQAKQYRQVVSAILDRLADACPHYSKTLEGTPYRRLALSEYRVVYRADEESVHVGVAGKRSDSEVTRALRQRRKGQWRMPRMGPPRPHRCQHGGPGCRISWAASRMPSAKK